MLPLRPRVAAAEAPAVASAEARGFFARAPPSVCWALLITAPLCLAAVAPLLLLRWFNRGEDAKPPAAPFVVRFVVTALRSLFAAEGAAGGGEAMPLVLVPRGVAPPAAPLGDAWSVVASRAE